MLYLATGVINESKGDNLIAEAGIVLLQQAADSKTPRAHEHTRQQWAELLQSALAKVVELVKNGKTSCNTNEDTNLVI